PPVTKNVSRVPDEQFEELERDAKRDAQAYRALLELDAASKLARKAIDALAAAHVVIENAGTDRETVYRLVGHNPGRIDRIELMPRTLRELNAYAGVEREALDVRVGHRTNTKAEEAALLWRARFAGIDDDAIVERLIEREPLPPNQHAGQRKRIV